MEHTPADARAAPSASVPNNTIMRIPSSPKRPRDPAQGNMLYCQEHMPEPARALHITPPLRVGVHGGVEPADARPASSASGPADTAPTDMSAQKRPRDPASGNMVSSIPMQNAPAMPASQFVTTDFLSTDTGRAC
eukprot:scaffold5220_cov147-Isochrysis_galbana.AAC.1